MKTNAEIQEAALMHCPHPRGMRGDWMDGFLAGVQWIQSYPPACPHLKWNHVHENQWEAVLPFGQGKYTIVGQPGGYFSALWGHNALPGRFDTLEAAQSACQDHWLDKWKDEMGRMA